MRILNVMLGRGLGGLEQALLDYAVALTQCGHEVHPIIHPNAALRPGLEAKGATLHSLPHAGSWDPLAATRLRRLLRLLRPDISIAHGNRAVSLLRPIGWLQLFGKAETLDPAIRRAEAVRRDFGVNHIVLDSRALFEAEGVVRTTMPAAFPPGGPASQREVGS